MMKYSDRLFSIRMVYSFSLLCVYLTSFLIFFRVGEDYIAHPKLLDQVKYLLLISLLLAALQILTMPSYIRFILLVIHGIIVFVIGYSFGHFLVIEVLVLIIYLSSIQSFFKAPQRYAISVVVILIFFRLQVSGSIYGEIIDGPDTILTTACSILLCLVTVIGDLHHRVVDRNRELLESQRYLENSIVRITSANIHYQDYISVAQTNAASKERLRITRDLHDALGYAFSNILLLGRLNLKMYDEEDDEIYSNMEKICQISQSGIQEMRRILRFFRRNDMGQLTGAEAISQLVKDFEYATGSSIRLEYTNARWQDGTNLDDVIYRLVQEGMVNAFRHGDSKSIAIVFSQDLNRLSITISNNLRINTTYTEGIGIQGMRERIGALNGSLIIKQIKGVFQISANFPCDTEGVI